MFNGYILKFSYDLDAFTEFTRANSSDMGG